MNLLQYILTKFFNHTLYRMALNEQIKNIPFLIQFLINTKGESEELIEILEIVKTNPNSMIPYRFVEKYKKMPVIVNKDKDANMPYADLDKRSVYFPSSYTFKQVRECVRQAIWEQADESPHRYLPKPNQSLGGKWAVLIGASDCLYALKIIPHFEHIYLFEPDPIWINPMKKTLSEFKHKVSIVRKFVGDKNDKRHITLDDFFSNQYQNINYIQVDIEGHELRLLKGAEKLLNLSIDLRLSLCCYHNSYDELLLGDYLTNKGFKVETSTGYMLMYMQYPLQYPYLRKGVLYAQKTRSR